jgi:hypothetical protein
MVEREEAFVKEVEEDYEERARFYVFVQPGL